MFQIRGAVLLTLSVTQAVAAQSRSVPATVVDIGGVVTEATSRRPAQRMWVCAYTPPRESSSSQPCAPIDSAGSYKLDHVPLGTVRLAVVCERLLGFGKTVALDTIVVVEPRFVRKDWSVQTLGCDTRPVRHLRGVFRGHYTGGFEESKFVPCPQDAWFLPGDSLDVYRYDARMAWAEIPGATSINWPEKVPHNSWGSALFYVRWRGAVTGPGRYGHMGVSAFEFRVDSILEIRAPRRNDCR